MRKTYFYKLFSLLISFILIIGLASCTEDITSEKTSSKAELLTKSLEENTEIEVTMLDVGQGLSILLRCGKDYMLYDGGGREYSSKVVRYLKDRGIDHLDYMVASHYDEDHIAGLVGVLNTNTVDQVLTPDYQADTAIYGSFVDKLKENGAKETHPSVGEIYTLGQASFQIIAPESFDAENDNDNSIVIRCYVDGFSCLLAGDAEQDSEEQMLHSGLELESDLLVLGHHGSSSSSSSAFLDQVCPKYAFISAGENNSYGHPTQKVLNRLKDRNIEIFRTDKQGDVTLTYKDGKISFDQEACQDWTPGVYSEEKNEYKLSENNTSSGDSADRSLSESSDSAEMKDSTQEEEHTYIINKNTGKFHRTTCNSIGRMKDSNKLEVTSTRDELITEGYSPCGNCKP